MKVIFLTGSHPRHAYMARAVAASGCLAGLVIEQREALMPVMPEGLSEGTLALCNLHFRRRDEAESRAFGAALLPDVSTRAIEMAELNTPETVRFINALEPDLVLSYGVHKLTPEMLSGINCKLQWNIHGGLSPWYRGVTTHFWPSYHLEPQMTGMTVHELTQDIDGGALIHQSAAELVRGDGLHDLACRAVKSLGEDLPLLIGTVAQGHLKPPHKQATTGRIWRSVDWQPAHLHLIYEQYADRIVDHYLDGAFTQSEPKLYRQF